MDGSNCEKGLHLVNSLNPQQVYVYAMGQEPWLTYLTNIQYTDESRPIAESTSLVQDCVGQGRVSERLLGCKEILLESHSESLLDTVGSGWVRSRAASD
ncbi:MAG TPA: hypothetical protein VJM50_21665 [Pyrinomonadaceae bacterium]|nr:hypothetical protein [Pyrinomonadaceae bacterium]